MAMVKFRATLCDTRTDKILWAASKVQAPGFAVTISFETEHEVTPEYLVRMANEIENLPPVNFKYFRNVRPATGGFSL